MYPFSEVIFSKYVKEKVDIEYMCLLQENFEAVNLKNNANLIF
jgi:hypothetical protein